MTNGSTNPEMSADEQALAGYFSPAEGVEPTLLGATLVEATLSPNTETASPEPNADSWRNEVAARLERYRTRRKPRTPRYPSLLLPFDQPESWSRSSRPAESEAIAIEPAQTERDFFFNSHAEELRLSADVVPREILELEQRSNRSLQPHFEDPPEPSAKVIEFPRLAAIPVFHASALADPIFDIDIPRIVEAPEILPPPPALGGMLMEPAPPQWADKLAAEGPFLEASGSIGRRVGAVLVDAVVLAASLAVVTAIFLRVNPIRGPVTTLVAAVAVATVALWMSYQYLFVVYTGSTPGLRVAKLQLARFDGNPLTRDARRWRVLASFLSAFSAGLGYLWCVLDQDGLCWHDRITRTYVQQIPPAE